MAAEARAPTPADTAPRMDVASPHIVTPTAAAGITAYLARSELRRSKGEDEASGTPKAAPPAPAKRRAEEAHATSCYWYDCSLNEGLLFPSKYIRFGATQNPEFAYRGENVPVVAWGPRTSCGGPEFTRHTQASPFLGMAN